LIREIELLGAAQVTLLADRRVFAPYGLNEGMAGAKGRSVLIAGGEERLLPGKCNLEAQVGDVVRIETPGGGGWGNA
jgi:N-methylhydantoinase B